MYSMCTSGTRCVPVCAELRKKPGSSISDTTCGGRPSAGNKIASSDCIKSIGDPWQNKILSLAVSEEEDPVRRRNSLQVTKEGGLVSFFSGLELGFFLESGERGDEDDDLWMSELAVGGLNKWNILPLI
jgi:hypothetical protein